MRLLSDGARTPACNLAVDEALLDGGDAVVRFYDWQPPGLSLGYFQRCADLDLERFRAAGYEVVRRPTGGGAIARAQELTFCVTDAVGGPFFGTDVATGYQRLHEALRRGLASLGVACAPRGGTPLAADQGPDPWLCFHHSSPLDLVAEGRKLLGSAERRRGGRVMHHGSLPLAPRPLTPGAISVQELAAAATDRGAVEEALVAALAEAYQVEFVPSRLRPEERTRAEQLVAERYGNPDWTGRR